MRRLLQSNSAEVLLALSPSRFRRRFLGREDDLSFLASAVPPRGRPMPSNRHGILLRLLLFTGVNLSPPSPPPPPPPAATPPRGFLGQDDQHRKGERRPSSPFLASARPPRGRPMPSNRYSILRLLLVIGVNILSSTPPPPHPHPEVS